MISGLATWRPIRQSSDPVVIVIYDRFLDDCFSAISSVVDPPRSTNTSVVFLDDAQFLIFQRNVLHVSCGNSYLHCCLLFLCRWWEFCRFCISVLAAISEILCFVQYFAIFRVLFGHIIRLKFIVNITFELEKTN